MSNVVILPVIKREVPAEVVAAPSPAAPERDHTPLKLWGVVNFVLLLFFRFLRICVVLAWPLLSKVLAVDVSFQFFRAVFRWHSVGSVAVVPFISHLLVFALLTLIVQTAAKSSKF